MRIFLVPLLLLLPCVTSTAAPLLGNEIFSRVKPLVFQIKTAISESAPKSSYGTGFVVDKSGLLITNFHVVSEAVLEPEQYKVYLVDGGTSMLAEVLAVNPVNDVALLRVARTFADKINISAEMPAHGSKIFSIGLPEDLNMSIVEGTYNGVIAEGPYSKIHMSSPINGGMSGGPTVDSKGQLIGVNVSKLVFASNISFAVPKMYPAGLLKSWAENKDKKAPGAVLLEKSIGQQLNDAGSTILSGIVAQKDKKRDFKGWKVPVLPPAFKCWSDSSRNNKEQKFTVTRESCNLQNSVYLGRRVSGGEFSLDLNDCERKGLNDLQFFDLVSNSMTATSKTAGLVSLISREVLSDLTPARCVTERVTNSKGLPITVHACFRQYSRFEGVWEGAFDMATMLKGKRNLLMSVSISGVSFENLKQLIRHFVDGVEEGKAEYAAN